jgi:hypothetical protein
VCDSVEQKEGTIVTGGVTWRLEVAVEAHRRQLESEVHGGLMLLTNSRWRIIFAKVEFVVFVSNIVYE